MFRQFLLTSVFLGLAAGTAWAQTAGTSSEQEAAAAAEGQGMAPAEEKVIPAQEDQQTLSADLIGMKVEHESGDKIGEIQSLLFDQQDRIVGGVVAVGGFLGIGAKSVALSWDSFDVNEAEQVAYLAMTKEQLEQAPDFKDLKSKEAEQAMLRDQEQRQQQMQQQMQVTSPGTAPSEAEPPEIAPEDTPDAVAPEPSAPVAE